jgi:hypothetical protein
MQSFIVTSWNGFGMGSNKWIELETGVDSWFKTLYFLLTLLAALALLIAHTAWSVKLSIVSVLFLFFWFFGRQMVQQKSISRVRIYSNATVTLINRTGQEFPGILARDNWTTRWVSIVPVGRFDRWRIQRLFVCASRNNASDYRQLIKMLRLGHVRDGILV